MTMRTAILVPLAALAAVASAQRASGVENGLLGIRLFDSGKRVVQLYGTPDQILSVDSGISSGGAGGGGRGGPPGPPGGFPGGSGGRSGRGAPSGGASSPGGGRGEERFSNPFAFGDETLRQAAASGDGPPPGAPGPGGGRGGPPGGFPGGPGGGGGAATPATLTRWIYNRNGSKYGFVIDKLGNVVQIEAIGLQNRKVKTKRGVGFGATFATLIKTYGNPDGYEINGDSLLVKYLSRQKVAFRLSRLGVKKPQVVTGVVVSAAKA